MSVISIWSSLIYKFVWHSYIKQSHITLLIISQRCAFYRKDDFKSSHDLRYHIKKYKEKHQALLTIQTDILIINKVM